MTDFNESAREMIDFEETRVLDKEDPKPEIVEVLSKSLQVKQENEKEEKEYSAFKKAMRGLAKKQKVKPEPGTLKFIGFEKDQLEYDCYQNSFFSSKFQLPRRKLCYKACMPAPGIPNTLLITQIIESTKEAGDISEYFRDFEAKNEAGYQFTENGEFQRLHFQLQVTHISNNENPKLQDSHLQHNFVYNCFDKNEEIDLEAVKIQFYEDRDVDTFELVVTPNIKFYLTISDLQQLNFPQNPKFIDLIARDLLIYQDQNENWLLHNPIENKALGALDFVKLNDMGIRKSLVKNKEYPGKLLFYKKWTENKIYSIDQQDFIKGEFLKHYEVPELKFHDEVEHSGSIGHELYSVGDRLVHRQMRENGEDTIYQLYDTKKRKVEYVKKKDTFMRTDNCLTYLFQKPEDAKIEQENENEKQKDVELQKGSVEIINGFTMELSHAYYSFNETLKYRGVQTTQKYYDCFLKKVIDVGCNYDGPIFQVEMKENKPTFTDIPLNRGKRMIYEDGTLYANIFANQIHIYNSFTQQVKVLVLEPSQRVLTTMRYAQCDKTFRESVYTAGFLIYDLKEKELSCLVTSLESRNLAFVRKIKLNLKETDFFPRDVHSCVVLNLEKSIKIFFQRKYQIVLLKIRNIINLKPFESLPIEMHVNNDKLHYIRKNNKGAFEIVIASIADVNEPETILGTDQNEIIASCCLVEGHITKIVILNSLREIRFFQEGQRTKRQHANISADSYDFGIPLLFPQFYLNLQDKSVIFNGQEYCAYSSKEDAEQQKQIESEIYPQFKVNQKDYNEQALTESVNQNTFILGRNIYKPFEEDFVEKVKRLKNTMLSNKIAKAEKMIEDKRTYKQELSCVPFIFYSVNRTEAFNVKRGINQQSFTLKFEEKIQETAFDKISQNFLILFETEMMILSKDAHFLKKVSFKDLVLGTSIDLTDQKISFDTQNPNVIKLTGPNNSIKSFELNMMDLNNVYLTEQSKPKNSAIDAYLEDLKKLLETPGRIIEHQSEIDDSQFLVHVKDDTENCYYVSLVVRNKNNDLFQKKRIRLKNKMNHFQDFDEFGLLIHTNSHVYEFFTGSKVFGLNELKGQIGNVAVNQEQTVMIAQKNDIMKELVVKLTNSKELKAYSETLKEHDKAYNLIQNLKHPLFTMLNPDSFQNFFQIVGLREVSLIQMLFENIQILKDNGKEKDFQQAIKKLFYPLRIDDKDATEAWDTYSLAIIKELKGSGELFIKNIAKLLAEGDEINSVAIKNLDFFELLFSYNAFPELLAALQGEQQIVEVYESKIPDQGSSFPSKTPFLTKELIQKKIGNEEGLGRKQTVYVAKIQLDFLLESGVIDDFCSLLEKIKDDKILGNETLEIVIAEIWRKTRPRILKFIFLPYLIYFMIFIGYISFVFKPRDEIQIIDWVLQIPCVAFSVLQLIREFKQMIKEGIYYFNSVGVIWNFLEVTSLLLVLAFIVMNFLGLSKHFIIYIIGGLAVFFLWLKLFYFMRMFQQTSAFVRMILEMLQDIRIFLFIFFVGVLAFSNSFYIFDMYARLNLKENADEDDQIAGNNFLSAFIYVYLQSLGELGFNEYNKSYAPTVYWIFFFASTIFLQITLLNLLIAIMGDTFDRIQEVQREAKTKEICSILSEFFFLIPQDSIAANCCIFVARYENKEDKENDSGTWEGKMTTLKNYITKTAEKLADTIEKATERLENKNNQSRVASQNQVDQIQTTMTTLIQNLEKKLPQIVVFDQFEAKEGEKMDQYALMVILRDMQKKLLDAESERSSSAVQIQRLVEKQKEELKQEMGSMKQMMMETQQQSKLLNLRMGAADAERNYLKARIEVLTNQPAEEYALEEAKSLREHQP